MGPYSPTREHAYSLQGSSSSGGPLSGIVMQLSLVVVVDLVLDLCPMCSTCGVHGELCGEFSTGRGDESGAGCGTPVSHRCRLAETRSQADPPECIAFCELKLGWDLKALVWVAATFSSTEGEEHSIVDIHLMRCGLPVTQSQQSVGMMRTMTVALQSMVWLVITK